MPLVKAKCTCCGANLEVDDQRDAAVCPYCNTPYVVEKAINNYSITNHISADVINIQGGKGADDLFSDALALIRLGAYKDAAGRLRKMLDEYPSDDRSALTIIRLAVDHIADGKCGDILISSSHGMTSLDPLNVALNVGGEEFSTWLNRTLEAVCWKIRTGEYDLEILVKEISYSEITFCFEQLPCVHSLIEEAKANAGYYEELRKAIHNDKLFDAVIQRLWGIHSTGCRFLIGGNFVWYGSGEGEYSSSYHFDALNTVISPEEFSRLGFELQRCTAEHFCPVCGEGKKRLLSSHCSVCRADLSVYGY